MVRKKKMAWAPYFIFANSIYTFIHLNQRYFCSNVFSNHQFRSNMGLLMRMILGVILLMKLLTKETDAKFFLVEIADNDVSRTRVELGMSTG